MLWFTDLCQPALELAAAQAPLGSWGVVLPAGVALAMFANVQRSFGSTPNAQGASDDYPTGNNTMCTGCIVGCCPPC